MTAPLISCMCVTRGRPEFVERAQANFEKQTYPNKELVFVTENVGTLDHVIGCSKNYLHAAEHIPVGTQRNACLELCRGEYVAVWDDDDFFAPDRLEYSLDRMLAFDKRAFVFYRETLLLADGTVALSVKRLWENSFFTRREDLLKVRYRDSQLDEDLHMVRMFRHRIGPQSIHLDPNYSKYVYVQHPHSTTWAFANHWTRNTKETLPELEARLILQTCGVL